MWEKKPALLLVLATVVILIGTAVTMVAPFFWVNTDEDRIAEITPYNPLELAGRDVYIREGCLNCHSQTVRPLAADVLRYGPYSQSGEFVYDQPFLWGSRRMGPDLARIGGKYPDSWHYKHNADPQSMFPDSNMPAYAFLSEGEVDPGYTQKKMEALGFPYEAGEISALEGKNEMDALVAYLQKLGTELPRPEVETAAEGEIGDNPFSGDKSAIDEGATLYAKNCAVCHGKELDGGIGPELEAGAYEDAELYELIYDGVTDAGMPAWSKLGREKVWKMVTFIQER